MYRLFKDKNNTGRAAFLCALLIFSFFSVFISPEPVVAVKITESNCESSGGQWRGNVPPGECAFTNGSGDTIVTDTGDLKNSYYTVNGKCYTGYTFISGATGNAKGTCEKDSDSGTSTQDNLTPSEYIDSYKKEMTDISTSSWKIIEGLCEGKKGTSAKSCVLDYSNKTNEFTTSQYITISKNDNDISDDDWNKIEKTCENKTGSDAESCVSEEVKKINESENTSCAVNGVGWIVCTVVQYLADTVEGLYQKIMDILFQVDVNMFTGGDVLTAWGSMRDIANVVMVIVFLFVIFSQITGFGISNYGIKNTLPRLLIGAILLNISYYICLLAIDVVNIVGFNVSGLISGGNLTGEGMGLGAFAGFLLSGVASASLAITTGITAVVYISAAGGIAAVSGTLLITLILCIVSVIIGVFTLLLRQIGILLLVVIAPLAFVSFILPNTKKWYDKWQKLFVSLLIIYPIAGAIVGVTTLAVKVIAATDNSIMIMMIPMVMCVPLAAIPFLTKQALNGLGSLGARINSLGSTLKGTASKQLNENTALGRQKKMAQRSVAQNRFKRDVTGNSIGGRVMNRIGGQKYKDQQQRAYSKFMAGEHKEDLAAALNTAESNYSDDPVANSYQNQLQRAINSGNGVDIEAVIEKMSADSSQHGALMDVLALNGDRINSDPNIQKATASVLSSNMGKLGPKNPAFKAIMKGYNEGKGVNAMSAASSASSYGATPAEIPDMKTDAILAGINSGGISPETARRVLASDSVSKLDSTAYEAIKDHAAKGSSSSGNGGGSSSNQSPLPSPEKPMVSSVDPNGELLKQNEKVRFTNDGKNTYRETYFDESSNDAAIDAIHKQIDTETNQRVKEARLNGADGKTLNRIRQEGQKEKDKYNL